MQEVVEAELRLETITQNKIRVYGPFADDENYILKEAYFDYIEICQMVEVETGKRLGFVKGEENRCSLEQYKDKMLKGNKYINLHNHPNYTSHSLADLYVLLTYEEIIEVRVICADRTYIARYDKVIETSMKELKKVEEDINTDLFNVNSEYYKLSSREKLFKRNQYLAEIYDIIFYEELI